MNTDPSLQRGAVLLISLLVLGISTLLVVSVAQYSMLAEKVSRNERDRYMALEAAEAGLMEAAFVIDKMDALMLYQMFVMPEEINGHSITLNLHDENLSDRELIALKNAIPAWKSFSIAYGTSTGHYFPSGGHLPSHVPRYMIETFDTPQNSHQKVLDRYRVSVIGYGVHDTTQVILQMIYEKGSIKANGRRLYWREVMNTSRLRERLDRRG